MLFLSSTSAVIYYFLPRINENRSLLLEIQTCTCKNMISITDFLKIFTLILEQKMKCWNLTSATSLKPWRMRGQCSSQKIRRLQRHNSERTLCTDFSRERRILLEFLMRIQFLSLSAGHFLISQRKRLWRVDISSLYRLQWSCKKRYLHDTPELAWP